MKPNIIFFAGLLAITSLTTIESKAQLSKGNWLIEGGIGNIGYNEYKHEPSDKYTSTYKSKGFSASLYPSVGYFVKNNIAIGTTVSFDVNNSKSITSLSNNRSENSYKWVSSALKPYFRYYFLTKESKFALYGQVQVGVSFELYNKTNFSGFSNDSLTITGISVSQYPKKYTSLQSQLSLGTNYFITENLAINASLGYRIWQAPSRNDIQKTYSSDGTLLNESSWISGKRKGRELTWDVGFTYILPNNANQGLKFN